ncbi:cyclase domain protein [Bordetella bronchiseptica E014]|nr:cyclase domain protein [Bordetella bronchiseptica E014]
MTRRWKQRPPGSNWGDFGDDDQLGRLNLLTPEKVREAVAEVQEGIVFSLSLPLDMPGGNVLNPARHPPRLMPTRRDDKPMYLHAFEHDHNTTDVACDDMVAMSLQYSTQWDALSHIGSHFDADGDGVAEIVFYNGYTGKENFSHRREDRDSPSRAHRLGIEHMAAKGVQGRGVLLDLRRHFGDERKRVGYDDLMRGPGHRTGDRRRVARAARMLRRAAAVSAQPGRRGRLPRTGASRARAGRRGRLRDGPAGAGADRA